MTAPFPIRPIPDGLAAAFLVHPRWATFPQMVSVFGIVDAVLRSLESGEIECEMGRPVFRDDDGTWTEVVPALLGWCDAFDRISRAAGIPIDMEPVRRLARRLEYGILLEVAELQTAKALTDRCRAIFLACFPWKRRAAVVDVQLAIAFEAMGLREAA